MSSGTREPMSVSTGSIPERKAMPTTAEVAASPLAPSPGAEHAEATVARAAAVARVPMPRIDRALMPPPPLMNINSYCEQFAIMHDEGRG